MHNGWGWRWLHLQVQRSRRNRIHQRRQRNSHLPVERRWLQSSLYQRRAYQLVGHSAIDLFKSCLTMELHQGWRLASPDSERVGPGVLGLCKVRQLSWCKNVHDIPATWERHIGWLPPSRHKGGRHLSGLPRCLRNRQHLLARNITGRSHLTCCWMRCSHACRVLRSS